MDETALLGLGPHADSQGHRRALQYFEQLKESRDGWKLCAEALTSGIYEGNDHVKFFCFQVIEHYIKNGYITCGPAEQEQLKALLVRWLQLQACSTTKDKTFLRNKLAQIFSLVFVVDYPHRWPSFLQDLLNTLQLGETAIDMYLRILVAIDSEVVDREIAHTPQETERNTMLKDTMRLQCVQQMVDSWYMIVTTYETSNAELTCLCLEVIGAYISWIDINLIANDRFVSVLLRFMNMLLLREGACDCIHEVIVKGMEPVGKVKLIESFMSVLKNAGIFTVTEDEDGDYLAKLSKLVNGIGLQLIAGWQKVVKTPDRESTKMLLDALESKVPLMYQFLAHEDDDVSSAVSKSVHDYLSVLKQIGSLSDQQKQSMKELLYIIIKKMKYDDSYSFEQEGEEEAMFQEYRKELKVIFNNLGALDGDLVLTTVQELVTRSLQDWQNTDVLDVEIAITLVYMLAESVSQLYGGDCSKTPVLQEILRLMVSSRVSCCQHSAVALQFFEAVVRYDKFFNQEPQFIPDVLMAFLDERGLRHSVPHVSSRASYLFSRFVKDINKCHLHNYLEEVLKQIQGLLVLNTPDNGVQVYLSSNDQLFLYETAGILVVQSQFEPEKKQVLMKQLLAPIVTKYDGLLQALVAETDENRQMAFAQCLSQAMAFASRTSKGFSSQQTMKQCGCVAAYTETLQVFLHALNTPVQRQTLHAGVRQFLHRMVVCLDSEVLPFIPVAMENLLKSADAKELHDFIPLLNQVISKFKVHIVPFLQEVFMPVVSTIFQVLLAPADERDQVAAVERKMLQRSYFSFISALVNNNVTQVLSNQDSQNLHQVLITIIQGAVDIPDPQGQKSCFSILRRLVEIWGGKDGLAGFEDFVYKSIVPACFMAPLKPTFDLSDGQTILALNECALCMKAILDKQGDELIQFLQSDYLPKQNVGTEIIQEFCQALKSDPKVFRNYYKSFFIRAKS